METGTSDPPINILLRMRIERKNEIKLLIKIFGNILENPNNSKYTNLNYNVLTQKLFNCQHCIALLHQIGFKRSGNRNNRFIYDAKHIDQLKHIYKLLLSIRNLSNHHVSNTGNHIERTVSATSEAHEVKYNDDSISMLHSNDNGKTSVQLKKYETRSLSCNGDCGSQFAKLIDNILYPKDHIDLHTSEDQIICDAFWLHDSPLRVALIKLLETKICSDDFKQYQDMLKKLNDPNCYINGNKWTNDGKQYHDMLTYFKTLYHNGHGYILQELANKTCLIPDRSLTDEINAFHKREKDRLQSKLNLINSKLTDIDDENNTTKSNLKKQQEQIQKQIKKWCTKQLIDYKTYQTKLISIKAGWQYLEMKKRNMALTEMEILSIMLYCDQDAFCYKMRESQREERLNSCEWKKLFYYICCAVYKISQIFHRNNKDFYIGYVKTRHPYNNKLYHGIHGIHSIQNSYSLHTISSFTDDISVAKSFTSNNGMILAIPDAFKAIYRGKLMAANVSWISKFKNENEFIVTPILFKKIKKIQEVDPKYNVIMDWDKIFVFEIYDYKSEQLNSVLHNASKRIQDPITFFGSMRLRKIEKTTETPKIIAAAISIGCFQKLTCSVCHIRSRLCEYSTSLLNGNAECPACRALFIQYPSLITKKMELDELECYNLKCKKKIIKHTDLEIVDGINYNLGYKCRYCKKQQRDALYDRYLDEEYLDEVSEKYMYWLENASESHGGFKLSNNPQRKKQFIKILKYGMHRDRYDDQCKNLFIKFPFIFQWVAEFNGAKKLLNLFGIGDLANVVGSSFFNLLTGT